MVTSNWPWITTACQTLNTLSRQLLLPYQLDKLKFAVKAVEDEERRLERQQNKSATKSIPIGNEKLLRVSMNCRFVMGSDKSGLFQKAEANLAASVEEVFKSCRSVASVQVAFNDKPHVSETKSRDNKRSRVYLPIPR